VTATAAERRALVDRLAADLQARVLSGELPSGVRLRQKAIAEEYGVSRTPVREALRKLQASGLVELRPNRGALVRGLSPRETRHAYVVRAELEGLAAELAAQHIREGELDRLRAAQAQFAASLTRTTAARERGGAGAVTEEETRLWARANDDFHQVIHEASGNDVLAGTLAHLHRSFPRDLTKIVLAESTKLLRDNVDEHEAILTAIAHRDPAGAREAMCRHVLHAGALVTLRLEEQY
jgi:DNA-binding GntR family transcriptional regulator